MKSIPHGFLLACSKSAYLENGDFDALLKEILCSISTALAVDRVSFWILTKGGEQLSCYCLYNRLTATYAGEEVLEKQHYPAYFTAFTENLIISAEDAATHPFTREFAQTYFQEKGITSMLDAQVLVKGELFGVLCLEQCRLRAWSREDEFYAISCAYLISQGYTTSRQLAETRRRAESEENYKQLFEKSPIPMWVYDTTSLAILDVNLAAIQHYGYTKEEFLKLTILDLRPNDEKPLLLQYLNRKNSRRQWESSEWKHKKKNGEEIIVELRSDWSFFQGRRCRIVMAFDITERKRIAERLSASEELFNQAFEANPAALLLLNKDSIVLQLNQAWIQLTGYLKKEVLHQNLADLHIFSTDFLATLTNSALQELLPEEVSIQDKAGNKKVLLLSLRQVKYENFLARIISAIDISEKKQHDILMAERLQEKTNFRNALDNSTLLTSWDLEGIILDVNEKFCECSGYCKEEVIGKSYLILDSGQQADNFWSGMWEVLKTGDAWREEVRFKRKDGTYCWVEVTINPVRNAEGVVYEYLLVGHNISKRKELLLMKENLLTDLTEYAFLTSHKLRGPLARLLGLINLLELNTAVEDSKKLLSRLKSTSIEMDSIIKQMNAVLHQNNYLPESKDEADLTDRKAE